MTDRAQQAADAVAAVAGLTPAVARRTLNEYAVRDQAAALAVAGGGSQSVKCVTVGIDHTDIVQATGLAPLYLLPENETLMMCAPVICTETFDGVTGAAGALGGQAAGPSGAGGLIVGDSFDPTQTNAANATDGLMAAGPPDATYTTSMTPVVTPVPGGGSVQLTVDFSNGAAPLNSIGTQGHIDVSLVLLVRS